MADMTTEAAPPEQPAAKVEPRPWLRPLVSLQVRDFRWFWISMLAAFSAMQMDQVARGWLVYSVMKGTATDLGLVTAAWGIPVIFLSLPGGVITDRMSKRNIMILAQITIGVSTLVMASLIWTGQIQLWHLLAAGAVMGSAFSFNGPSRQAIVPELVEPINLMNAIALNSSAMNLTRIGGPALAGVLIGIVSVGGVYSIVVLMYVASIATLFMVTSRSPRPRPGVSPVKDMFEGLSYIRHNRTILALLGLESVAVLFAFPYVMLMPVFAKDIFKVGAEGYGALLTVTGVGALAGSLGVASLGNFQRKGVLVLVTAGLYGLGLPLFANAGSFYPSLALLLVVGLAGTTYMAVNNTLLLSNTPAEMRGRVMSVYMMIFGLMPFSALPSGMLTDVIGAPLTLTIGGSILAAFVLLISIAVPNVRKLT